MVTDPLQLPRQPPRTGLRADTPVSLGYVDMVMTALGAGVCGGGEGVYLLDRRLDWRRWHARGAGQRRAPQRREGSGYVGIALPSPGLDRADVRRAIWPRR